MSAELGSAVTYVELDADHFLFFKQADEVQAALRPWLARLEAD